MNNSLFHGDIVRSNRTIYTPSTFARNNLLFLQEVGELTAKQKHTSGRKNLNSLLFFVVLKGNGILKYEDTVYNLEEDDCVFIDCENEYLHQTSKELWTLKWIHFYGTNAKQIFAKYCQRGGKYHFKSENLQKYIRILANIQAIANSNSFTQDMQIYSQLALFLNNLMEETWYGINTEKNGKKQKKGEEVKYFIDQNYYKRITLDSLSNIFYIDKYYLSKVFKREYDITVNNYLTNVRISEAKKMLRFSNKTIEEVAQAVGLDDANYFSRVFKKKEEISPKEFRLSWNTNN